MRQQSISCGTAVTILFIFSFSFINGNVIHEFKGNGQTMTYEFAAGPDGQYQLQQPQQQQQQETQLQSQEQQPQQEERHNIDQMATEESAHVPVVAESGSSGVWQEATSVGHSAWSQGMTRLSEMFVNLGIFQLLLIPAILLTGVYMIYVAYNSPYNAQSHYLVDSVPGHGGTGYGGNNFWKKSLNSFTKRTIDDLTPKILDAIKEFAAKY